MEISGSSFEKAVRDYRYLLDRGYPEKTSLGLIATRYSLAAAERSVLFRGIASNEKSILRGKKLSIDNIKNEKLHIDLLNVLLTVHAYLIGSIVFISTDGFLRDAEETRGKQRLVHFDRSITLINQYLESEGTGAVFFYVDSKPDISEKVSKAREILLKDLLPESNLILEETSDHILEKKENGLVCTSDSIIIERCKVPVIDLPFRILTKNFSPEFFDITSLR
jgi:hypothetical protein